MGQYGNFWLPPTFNQFKTKDVVTKRQPGFSTIFDVSHMGIFETRRADLIRENFLVNLENYDNKSKLSAVVNNKGHIIDDVIIGDVDKSLI